MLALLLFLTIVWIVLGIVGATVHGLLWLLVLAAAAFLLTWIFGGFRLGRARARR